MNRYILTAKSLALPESSILQIGMIIGIVIAIFMAFAGMDFVFSALAAVFATGIAHNAYLLSRSERRRTVPGMNKAAAAVSICLVFIMTLITTVLTFCLHGFSLDLLALSFTTIAFALWFGWGERLIFWILAILIVIFGLFSAWITIWPSAPEALSRIIDRLSDGSLSVQRNLFGLVVGVIGCWALKRFWKLSTTENPLDSAPRLHEFMEEQVATILELSPASESETTASATQSVTRVSRSAIGRLRRILYGKAVLTNKGYVFSIVAATIVLAVMIVSRGNDEATGTFQLFATLIISVVPLVAFAIRVPQSFSRVWIMGVAENRDRTARKLLLIVVRRSLPWFALIVIAMAIQSSTSSTILMATLFAMVSAIGVSGILLWIAVRWYPFWARQSDVTIMIGMILMILALFGFASWAAYYDRLIVHEYKNSASGFLAYFGIVKCFSICVLVVIGIWTWCVYDAAKGLGRAIRLMELKQFGQSVYG